MRLPGFIVLLALALVPGLGASVAGAQPVSGVWPDDALFPEQWALDNPADTDVDAPEAWGRRGSWPVVVAVLDTGIDWSHPDLRPNVWQNLAEDADGDGHTLEFIDGTWQFDPGDLNGVDDDDFDGDPTTFVDDLIGWDFVEGDNDPRDTHGHGTHLSGIIGAATDNGIGVAGLGWTARLMALRIGLRASDISVLHAAEALAYARHHGARVANASWGTGLDVNALREEVSASGMLVVAAAGNGGTDDLGDDLDARTSFFPASYDFEHVLSVAASDTSDALLPNSNYGAETVDLAAPGADILSTTLGGGYGLSSGTSMAAALASGAAALVWATFPELTPEQVRPVLMLSVDPGEGAAGRTLGGGRLNANAALRIVEKGVLLREDHLDFGIRDVGEETVLSVTVENVGDQARTVRLFTGAQEFAVRDPMLTVEPGGSAVAGIAYAGAEGRHTDTLSVDIEGSVMRLPLRGTVARSAVAVVLPESLTMHTWAPVRIFGGHSSVSLVDSLVIGNDGGRTLSWNLERSAAPWLSLVVRAGFLEPGERAVVPVEVRADALRAGTYEHTLVLNTNDPARTEIFIPVTLTVERPMPALAGGSVAWGDYDADGDLDLLVTGERLDASGTGTPQTLLYRNDGGLTFTEQPTALPPTTATARWGDYDADGDLDLALSDDDETQLFRNDGAGHLSPAGLAFPTPLGTHIRGGDYDADGDLDLLGAVALYRNDRARAFVYARVDDSDTAGIGDWADYDADGDLDLVVPHPDSTILFRHLHHGRFDARKDLLPGVEDGRVSWVDLDRDGLPDAVLSGRICLDAACEQRIGGTLGFLSRDSLSFEQTLLSQIGALVGTLNWGDFDGNGFLDALLTNDSFGALFVGGPYRVNAFNFGTIWLDADLERTSAAWADFDNDGALDFAMNGVLPPGEDGAHTLLFRNSVASSGPPPPPENLSASVSDGGVTFRWWDGPAPPVEAWTYNLYVGTAPRSIDVVAPMADLATGYRRGVGAGNAGGGTQWRLCNLTPGRYFWGLQTIDSDFDAAPFVEGEPFEIIGTTVGGGCLEGFPGIAEVGDGAGEEADDDDTGGESGDDGAQEGGDETPPPEPPVPPPSVLAFHAPYPNPWAGRTSIPFDLPLKTEVRLSVFDLTGRRVAVVADGVLPAGRHEVVWEGGAGLPAGVYALRFETPSYARTRMMAIVR